MDNKNSIIAVLVLAALLFSLFTIFSASEWSHKTSARSALLYSPENNEILYSKNENLKLPMASTTKIMTALVALEKCRVDEVVTVSNDAVGIEGSSAYLKGGDTYSLEDLLYALLLQSANDAAVAIAIHTAGNVDTFVSLMNEKAIEIGAYNTSFKNPNGLDNEGHFTTALDLAKITAVALENEEFARIISTSAKTITSNEGTVRNFTNHNKLLFKYDDCIGVKTGFTKKSGRCLVGAAERGGLTLISVTLDAPDDWNDHINMLDYGFSVRQKLMLLKKEEINIKVPVISGNLREITLSNTEDVYAIVPQTKKAIIHDIVTPKYVVAPINTTDKIGEISFYLDDEKIAATTLSAKETVKYKNKKH